MILGTQYAGEMKKGVFTIMHYLMPKRGVLSMHCSANEGPAGDVSLFFGLSGTGKTTLSADPRRKLIGDDEHCWSDRGVFNIEGGCYAKCINLSAEKEPEIYRAIRFGTVLENVVIDPRDAAGRLRRRPAHREHAGQLPDRVHSQRQDSLRRRPSAEHHLAHVRRLRRVAAGRPSSRRRRRCTTSSAATRPKSRAPKMGVTEPEATFSACYGAAFLVWHPMKYAQMLADKMQQHQATAWLVNTGWTGGCYGTGSRIRLAYTRAIIDAIHSRATRQGGDDD